MEDMARLAMVEQSVGDPQNFHNLLLELLSSINCILDDPHDYDLRCIKRDTLKSLFDNHSLTEYLKYIGFEKNSGNFVYPKEQTLNKLRMAQSALERKLYFCLGHTSIRENCTTRHALPIAPKPILKPANILFTHNEFLLKIQMLFNNMIQYEDDELQEHARSIIPIITLQLKAKDRMREQQKKIKSGEIKGPDLPFDKALLIELMGWFKHDFFRWVDKPDCHECQGPTEFVRNGTVNMDSETCRLELYRCPSCSIDVGFTRHNDPRVLLSTRRGRCGEWANAFTLLCRSLNYDTRYVYDTTDHVWCEVFDYDSNSWIHLDPCEGKFNSPLMYSHGWKKNLSYVIALSRDDLQDVTWRYTSNHREVRTRRTLCSEEELISTLMTLRKHRQNQVSEARRKYLTKRLLKELVELMVERTPTDYEAEGRISGSITWRKERGEIGVNSGHMFLFSQPGIYAVRYYTGSDKYRIVRDGVEIETLDSWEKGVFISKNMFRKVEKDWKMTYLAREEGTSHGSISWKLMINDADDVEFCTLSVRLIKSLYENGRIDWSVQFDSETPARVNFGDTKIEIGQRFKEVTITGELSGGIGDVAWQHAQLFRQKVDEDICALEIVTCVRSFK